MDKNFECKWLGVQPYQSALDIQMQCFEQVKNQPQVSYILGLEHSAVITLGLRSKATEDLNLTAEDALQQGIEIVTSNRGGEATLHSPGQLVIYPVFALRQWGLGVRQYVELLQDVTIRVLKSMGIEATASGEEPGVYTSEGKIVFVGIKVSAAVCYHGISINICNDLDLFNKIRSCGVRYQSMDRVSNYSEKITPETFFRLWITQFIDSIQPQKSNTVRT